MFDSTKGALLVAPSLSNSSCWLNGKGWPSSFPATTDILKALFIFAMSMCIVFGNLVLICVLNNRRYIKYIDNQPRYLLTSLALNDLFTGILIAPVALLPALYKCWPYGEIFCQIQALLRGAVSQQSAVILVCMAIDRYMYLLHPNAYHRHSSKKGCVLVISITWILSVSLFAMMVLPRSGYYFNSTGLMACDVFHSRVAFRILACCAYYFPTTMALMYCYGSGFHVSKTRTKSDHDPRPNGVPPCKTAHNEIETVQIPSFSRPHSMSTSRTMAAISLGFIVMVTPSTIQEVVAACTGCKVPPILDFIVTWLALSNSFWNPFLYWLLNSHFRRISHELVQFYICCKRPKSFAAYEKGAGCCGSSVTSDGLHSKGEFEGLGEKFWGEILERTVSSTSLHAIQKNCHRDPLRYSGSFKGYHSGSCKHNTRFYDGYGPTDHRQFERSAFQIEACSRQCRLKNSDFCLFRPGPELDYSSRSRSNLSLDEGNFNKICNGRHPDL
ncbi:5-hydroxytryptamine receptor 1A [Aricia agestis]|uniref:5-hydroxytryptamine receptor 1A n=1 Tax=Aricia agestis TaxID=91739 RepID=UPI001C209399|nr:5-hydroxytryptamine receptor 1A [Aricia agestis]XP_041980026.1 5-hydroxytryptamine receptor 1A [Aricia agestis]